MIMVVSTVKDTFSGFCLSINLVVLLVFSSSLLFAVPSDGLCGECALEQICCNDYCIYGSSCHGFFCKYDSDCSTGESCCFNVCVNGSSCLGHSCSSDVDCKFGEGCCNKKCKEGYDCAGYFCSTNSDCGEMEYCCGNTCGHYTCTDISYVVVISSIVGILCLLLMISLLVLLIHRRKRPRRVLLGQSLPAQAYQTLQDPRAPPYRQSYPYHPPPSYEEGSPKQSNEPPSPYNSETKGLSGGVNSPQKSYGAVANPSTPVV